MGKSIEAPFLTHSVDNDWSGRTSGFYGRYFQKEAQKDHRVSSGVLLKIEVGISDIHEYQT